MYRIYPKYGQNFGFLTVLHKDIQKSGKTYYVCKCICGEEISVRLSHLKSQKSCGCRNRFIHGRCRTTEYKSWMKIKERCLNKKCPYYPSYGGRGIKIYEKWIHDFKDFYEYIGPKPGSDYSVDRIDNNGNYEPGNVKWSTQKEQARNCRTNRLIKFEGKTLSLSEWAEKLGIKYNTLQTRLDRGWSIEKAFNKSVEFKSKCLRKGLTVNGVNKSFPEWGRESGINFKTIINRINNGWSPELAVSVIPSRKDL